MLSSCRAEPQTSQDLCSSFLFVGIYPYKHMYACAPGGVLCLHSTVDDVLVASWRIDKREDRGDSEEGGGGLNWKKRKY